jgi:hypothetical protein
LCYRHLWSDFDALLISWIIYSIGLAVRNFHKRLPLAASSWRRRLPKVVKLWLQLRFHLQGTHCATGGGRTVSRSNTKRLSIRLLMIVFTIVLFGADMTVSAQNANSSTTTPDESMQSDTMTNTNTNRTGRRRRRGRRRGGNMNAAAMTPVSTGRCDPMVQEQTDLSGTYTGSVDYPEGGLSGQATLTITGNDFTMTSGSSTQEGRVVAVTTCNYTAVTMRFGKDAGPAPPGTTPPPPLPTVSLRARRTGNGITLAGVSGESRQFSFSSGGGGGRRGRRRAAPTPTMTHGH